MDNQNWLEEIASGTRPSRAGRPELPEELQAVALAYDTWAEVLPTERQEVELAAWNKLRLEAMKALNGGVATTYEDMADDLGSAITLAGTGEECETTWATPNLMCVAFRNGAVALDGDQVHATIRCPHLEEPQRSVCLAVLDKIREWVDQGVL